MISNNTYSQNKNNSFLKKYNYLKVDTNLIHDFLNIAHQAGEYMFTEKLTYSNYALRLSESINYQYGVIKSKEILCLLFTESGLNTHADHYFNEVINYYNEKGLNIDKLELLKKVSSHYIQLLEAGEAFKYTRMYYDESGKGYFLKYESDALSSLGYLQMRFNKPDSAIFYIQKSLSIAKELNNKPLISKNTVNLANSYLYKKDYKKALNIFLLIDPKKDSLTNNQEIIYSYLLALTYYYLGNKAKTNLYYDFADNSVPDINEELTYDDLYIIKYKTDSTLKYYNKALYNYQRYTDFKIFTSKNAIQKKSANFQGINNLQLKENENLLLKRKNKLLTHQNKRKTFIFRSLLFGAILIFITLFFILWYIKIKSKTNKLLESKNIQLIEQNNELLSMNEEITSQKEDIFIKNEEISTTIKQLRIAHNQLIQADKMASLGILAVAVSNDLKSPIKIIKEGYSELGTSEIRAINEDKRYLKATKIINEGIQRTENILSALKTYIFDDQSKPVKTNINDLINYALRLFQHDIDNDIYLSKDLSKLPEIMCIPDKIIQAIINVLNNAVDALNESTQKEKRILIQTETKSINKINTIIIKIYNSYDSLNDKEIEKFFDPFYTTKDPDKGRGLGLTIAYNNIKEHNGNISLSYSDGGIQCTIELFENN